MKYTKLGNTGLDVSELGLGGMTFGEPEQGRHNWTLTGGDARAIIRSAVDGGINFFDTANEYSHGDSERVLGTLLPEFTRRDEIVIATKVYSPMHAGPNSAGLSRKSIFTEIDESLRRLGTDYIDLYQIHRFDNETPLEETLECLHDLVKLGKVRYIGASSMKAWQFAKALRLQAVNGWTQFVSMQNYYNLLYREEEREMLPMCLDQGVGVIPWSPLSRGRLARPWGSTTARSQNDEFGSRLLSDVKASDSNDEKIVATVQEIAVLRGVSMSQVAIAWLLSSEFVTAPIVGARDVAQLEDTIRGTTLRLTADEIDALESRYLPHALTGGLR